MLTFNQILEYETSRLSLVQSIWYVWFTASFVRKVKRKYDYYITFMARKYEKKVSEFLKMKVP